MNLPFTEAFARLGPEEREAYHRTVFLQMETPAAAQAREQYYRGLLRAMGEHVRIGCGVRIINPQNMSLGNGVSIDDHCTLIARSERGLTLGDETRLKVGVYLDTEGKDGYIEVGKRVYIGTGCCLHGHRGLEIGDDTLLAQNITVTPYSHRFEDPLQPIIRQGGHSRRITIGRDCYLGMCVCVLWSADIGDGAVVGAGSVVVKSVPPYQVAVGVPARVIRRRGTGGSAAVRAVNDAQHAASPSGLTPAGLS